MTELAPWLRPKSEIAAPAGGNAPVLSGDNLAPWLINQPSVTEPTIGDYAVDAAKAAPSGLAKGVIGIAGTGGDLSHIAKAASDKATEKGVNPFSFLAQKFEDSKFGQWLKKESAPYQNSRASGDLPGSYELPSSADIKGQAEKVTGKLYEPKYGPGKAVQTGFEIAPGLALGGGPVRGLIAKSTGAGVASELAGEVAEAIKDKLPETMQPWAEPVARAAGAIGGTFTPGGARRVVTPSPMTDEQLATVTALRTRDPNFPMSAGQATQSPKLMAMEARSPLAQRLPEEQERAFTAGALREAGIPSNDFRNIGQGQAVGQELGTIRRANDMTEAEFKNLQRVISQERANLSRATGPKNIGALTEIRDEVRNGASGVPGQALNMTGKRYEWLRDNLQGKIDAATSPQEKQAISRIRDQLDTSYKASLPADVAERLTQLEGQYANYNVLKNVPANAGRETVSPQEVISAVGKNWGNGAANEGRGTLVPYAQDASRVMAPHPKVSDNAPAWFDLVNSAAFALVHGGAGAAGGHAMGGLPGAIGLGSLAGSEGGVLGHLLKDSMYKGLAGAGSRVVSNPLAQGYLANQRWRPGPSSTMDQESLIRLLTAPTVQGQSQ